MSLILVSLFLPEIVMKSVVSFVSSFPNKSILGSKLIPNENYGGLIWRGRGRILMRWCDVYKKNVMCMNFVLESCKSLQTQKILVIFLKDWYLNLY